MRRAKGMISITKIKMYKYIWIVRKSIANIYEMLNDGHNIKSFIYCSIFSYMK